MPAVRRLNENASRCRRGAVRWFRSPRTAPALILASLATAVIGLPFVTSTAATAAAGPGTMKVSPLATTAGTAGLKLKFTYTAPSATASGTVQLTVPAGWTAPVTGPSGAPGRLTIPSKTCSTASVTGVTGSGPWVVAIKVNCAAGKKFKLAYAGVTAPTQAGPSTFSTSLTHKTTTTVLASPPVVTVGAGPATQIVLQGGASSVAPELHSSTANYTGPNVTTYTAEAEDQFGNDIGDVTSSTAFNVSPDGECDLSECWVDSAGPHTVTATEGSFSTTVGLDGDLSLLDMTCIGSNYDVNGDVTDGCEQLQPDQNTTLSPSTTSLGAISCNDGNGDTVSYSGSLLSDTRVHNQPQIPGFDSTTGSAPEWRTIDATGGTFCVDDVVLTLAVSGSSQPLNCYKFTVITDRVTYSVTTDANGIASINHTTSQYNDGSTIDLEVQKVCGTSVTEAVTYSVNGHL